MATMDALMVEAVGKPVIKTKRPIPIPSEGEILIKVTVVGLNPYDHRVRDWGLFVEHRLPVVIGNDIAGTIEKLGPNTSTSLKVGDHVFGQTNYLKESSDQSGLQEYCLLDAYTCAKIPEGLTSDDGASLVCNIVASFWAIFGVQGHAFPFPFPAEDNNIVKEDNVDFSKETILIIGAGSNCGKYAVQLSALAGFGTIIVIADLSKNESDLRSYGATHFIDRHASDVEAQVRNIVGDGLIHALDAVNVDHTLGVSVLSNTKKGALVCLVPGKVDEEKIGKKQMGFEDKFSQGISHNQPELAKKFWKWLPVWMREGKVKSTGWTVLEGLDAEKVNVVLDEYRDGNWPSKQVHVHL